MEDRWCSACGVKFTPRAQSPGQTYCPLAQCQRTRKQVWQQVKRRSDPDYSANQAKAQKDWAEKNPDYWRSYRATNPEYVQSNRVKQGSRNAARRIAKMDTSTRPGALSDGIYRLQLIGADAHPDKVVLVRLTILGKADA
jgi:uncharacterized Zn finger protein (UPF0148 family)